MFIVQEAIRSGIMDGTVALNKQKNKLLMWYNGRKQNCERIGLAEYRIK